MANMSHCVAWSGLHQNSSVLGFGCVLHLSLRHIHINVKLSRNACAVPSDSMFGTQPAFFSVWVTMREKIIKLLFNPTLRFPPDGFDCKFKQTYFINLWF